MRVVAIVGLDATPANDSVGPEADIAVAGIDVIDLDIGVGSGIGPCITIGLAVFIATGAATF